ncbi:MAG: endonuclease [Planctomycetaceae bacterium]|nr:endonuclease [Planctomycetaceae bacterium]
MPTAPKPHRRNVPAPKPQARRRTPAQDGYDRRWASFSAQWIQEQFAAGNYRCAACGKILDGGRSGIHVDHKRPHNGPTDPLFFDEDNLQMLHPSCHSRKTAKTDGGFGNGKRG